MRFWPALFLLVGLASCATVYVQTGSGSIERSTEFERSAKGRTTIQEKKSGDEPVPQQNPSP